MINTKFAAIKAPANWQRVYAKASEPFMPLKRNMAKVTAGLKWAWLKPSVSWIAITNPSPQTKAIWKHPRRHSKSLRLQPHYNKKTNRKIPIISPQDIFWKHVMRVYLWIEIIWIHPPIQQHTCQKPGVSDPWLNEKTEESPLRFPPSWLDQERASDTG